MCILHLSDRANWKYTQRELDAVELFVSRMAPDNLLGSVFVRWAPSNPYMQSQRGGLGPDV